PPLPSPSSWASCPPVRRFSAGWWRAGRGGASGGPKLSRARKSADRIGLFSPGGSHLPFTRRLQSQSLYIYTYRLSEMLMPHVTLTELRANMAKHLDQIESD